jgi:ABC-2 type transport system ATP-binding protein
VLIIDDGKLIYDGPLSTIKERFGKYRTITFEMARPAAGFVLPAGAETIEAEDYRLVLRFDRTRTTASQVAADLMRQVEVKDFSLAEPDLSTIIRQIYTGGLNGERSGAQPVHEAA